MYIYLNKYINNLYIRVRSKWLALNVRNIIMVSFQNDDYNRREERKEFANNFYVFASTASAQSRLPSFFLDIFELKKIAQKKGVLNDDDDG